MRPRPGAQGPRRGGQRRPAANHLRVPPRPGATAQAARAQRTVVSPRQRASALRRRLAQPQRADHRQRQAARRPAVGRHPDAMGRIHRRLARAAESGRNDHQRVNEMTRQSTTQQIADEYRKFVTRRWFFKQCGVGLGAIALRDLLTGEAASAAGISSPNPLAPKLPHYFGKAKRVIYLFMAGAPSHLELFDNKPELAKWDGKLPPADLLKGYRTAFINPNATLLGP